MTVAPGGIRRAAMACLLLWCGLGAPGCCTHAPPARPAYFGPTASLDEVISGVDANNEQIPSLWARADFDGTIVDEKKNSHGFSARGVVLYRAPHELLIRANDNFGNLLFEIGVADDVYWLKSAPQDTMWWGRMATAGAASAAAIPIRPDLVLDVLAVGTMRTNLSVEPFPVMRFDNADDVYIVDSIRRGRDRLLVEKEVWYDRQTLSPRKVILFDETGRETLRADLSESRPIADSAATIATHLELFFPSSGSVLRFRLSEQANSKKGVPHEGSIHIPDLSAAGMKNVIEIGKQP